MCQAFYIIKHKMEKTNRNEAGHSHYNTQRTIASGKRACKVIEEMFKEAGIETAKQRKLTVQSQ